MSAPTNPSSVLRIRDLSISFGGNTPVVDRASLELTPGEVHGLVGESGSGKTMIARSILNLLPPGACITDGSIRLGDTELRNLSPEQMRKLRGGRIGMVFQEPMMSLNPALKIGRQMAEAMTLHSSLDDAAIRRLSIEMLERVRMPDPEGCLDRYPHVFSGGMRQRIMLASVLMVRPALLLADEPTTALDVLIQKEVLEIMLEVIRDLGTAVLLITHDLGLVAKYAQRITVLEHGVVVEQGSVEDLLSRPSHSYTRKLLAALPSRHKHDAARLPAAGGAPLVEIRDLEVVFATRSFFPWQKSKEVRAVDGVSFDIRPSETVAVVGESGSGKTTLGRAILGLIERSGGRVLVEGLDTAQLDRRAARDLHRKLQIVFQDPYSSLDPRKRIGQIVGESLRLVPGLGKRERREKVASILVDVGIDPGWTDRFPHELSGGQRQRIGIARAIISHPRLIVADEAVSALDLTVQAQILTLFKSLQARFDFSYLFIAHDLGVVEEIADRIIVMFRGRIVEMGTRDDIFDHPRHPYTCSLLNAVPELRGDESSGYRLSQREYKAPPPPQGLSEDLRYHGDPHAGSILAQVASSHFAAFSAPAGRE